MSRTLARSISADLIARSFNGLLFLLLFPFIFVLSRLLAPVKTRERPFSAPEPGELGSKRLEGRPLTP